MDPSVVGETSEAVVEIDVSLDRFRNERVFVTCARSLSSRIVLLKGGCHLFVGIRQWLLEDRLPLNHSVIRRTVQIPGTSRTRRGRYCCSYTKIFSLNSQIIGLHDSLWITL